MPCCPHCGQACTLAMLLSRREAEVLQSLGKGRTGQEIADELFISPKTVATHILHIKQKLGIPKLYALMIYAAAHAEGVLDERDSLA